MKAAEFFINIGLKGTEKAVSGLNKTNEGMKNLVSSGFAAKAAMAGVIYGLERLMSGSMDMGTQITNFSTATGIATKDLQQWSYAARQAGVNADEIAGSMKGVQNAMTSMAFSEGTPAWFGMVSEAVKLDRTKINDTLYVMQKLQEFAQKAEPKIAQKMLSSFGLSEGTIVAMQRNAFTLEKLKKAPYLGQGQLDTLRNAGVMWENIWQKVKLVSANLTAKHGPLVIGELGHAANEVMKLGTAFGKLMDASAGFKALAISVAGIAAISFAPLTASIVALTAVLSDLDKGKKGIIGKTAAKSGGTLEMITDMLGITDFSGMHKEQFGKSGLMQEQMENWMRSRGYGTPQKSGSTTINTHIHTDTKDPKSHGNIVNKEIIKASSNSKAVVEIN